MNWEAIGAIGEVTGSLAVVISLLYLAVQLKQNTSATKSAARFESGRYWSTEAMHGALNPDIARITATALRDAKELTDEERERWIYWITQAFLIRDTMYQEYVEGLFPEDLWSTHKEVMKGMLRYDSISRILDAGVMPLSASFTLYLNKIRKEDAELDWHFHDKARIFD